MKINTVGNYNKKIFVGMFQQILEIESYMEFDGTYTTTSWLLYFDFRRII